MSRARFEKIETNTWVVATMAAVMLVAVLGAVGADLGLRDHAIASSGSIKYLDGNWTAHTGAGPSGEPPLSIPSAVPGDRANNYHTSRRSLRTRHARSCLANRARHYPCGYLACHSRSRLGGFM